MTCFRGASRSMGFGDSRGFTNRGAPRRALVGTRMVPAAALGHPAPPAGRPPPLAPPRPPRPAHPPPGGAGGAPARGRAERGGAPTSAGHLELVRWAGRFPERRFALEDCRHLSRRLSSDLLVAGEAGIRGPPQLMAGGRGPSPEPRQ